MKNQDVDTKVTVSVNDSYKEMEDLIRNLAKTLYFEYQKVDAQPIAGIKPPKRIQFQLTVRQAVFAEKCIMGDFLKYVLAMEPFDTVKEKRSMERQFAICAEIIVALKQSRFEAE